MQHSTTWSKIGRISSCANLHLNAFNFSKNYVNSLPNFMKIVSNFCQFVEAKKLHLFLLCAFFTGISKDMVRCSKRLYVLVHHKLSLLLLVFPYILSWITFVFINRVLLHLDMNNDMAYCGMLVSNNPV